MVSKVININEKEYHYELTYKQMKSIRIKVEHGLLKVSAPYMTPLSYIEDCLIRYQSRWLSQVMDYVPLYEYCNNGYVLIFNQKYDLKLRDVRSYQCQIHHHELYVYHQNVQKCVETFLKKLLLDYIEERMIYYLANDFDLGMPIIEIKKYKGRWGSCFYKQNKVSFNLSLIHLDKDLIDYVIVHELAHFIEANHSKQFYKEIEKRIPDYKKRIERIKEIHI